MRTASRLDTRAVGRGALAGLAVIVPVTIAQEVILTIVDDPCTDPVVVPIFLLIMAGFTLAGFRAARTTFGSPYPHGLLAGLATFAAWLPLKLGKTAVFGGSFISDDCGTAAGLVSAIIGGVTVALLAMCFGIAGGFLAARRARR